MPGRIRAGVLTSVWVQFSRWLFNVTRPLGRLRLAGIGADGVAVAGQLEEALPGVVGRHRSVVDLTADRSLEHGRLDEGGFGMRVTGRIAARAVFDEHTRCSCRGTFGWQFVLVDEGHLGVLLLWRIRADAAERKGGDKQRTEDAFHRRPILPLADAGSGSCV